MRRMVAVLAALALLTALCITPAIANEPTSGSLVKVDRINPVQATDVEIGKKVTVKGSRGVKGQPSLAQPTAIGTLNNDPIGGDGQKYAIVVGISDYPGTANDLSYCDDDAQDTYNALVNVYKFNNVTLLKDLAATRSAIVDAINALPDNAGEIVFSVSSHGSRGMANDGDDELWDEAIIAHDGTTTRAIWDGELKDLFARFSSAKIVFIFDTCYAGGMKEDLQGQNRFIAMACGEKQLSVEGYAWQNGEFTYYLVDQGILGGLANTHDYNGDGIYQQSNDVTAEEAFDYAMANCKSDHPTVGDYYNYDFPF